MREGEHLEFVLDELEHKNCNFSERVYEKLKQELSCFRSLPVIYFAILKNLEATDDLEDVHKDILKECDPAMISQLKPFLVTNNEYLDPQLLEDVIDGKKTLCHSAIYTIISAMREILNKTKPLFAKFRRGEDLFNTKYFLISWIFRHIYCWRLLCRSFSVTSDEIFYSDTRREDISLLEEHIVTVVPKDMAANEKILDSYIKTGALAFGILENSFDNDLQTPAFFRMAFSAILLRCSGKGEAIGTLFQSCVNEKTLKNNSAFSAKPGTKKIMNSTIKEQVDVDRLLYVTMSKNDDFTLENVMEQQKPEMMAEDLDLPFSVEAQDTDPTTHLRINLISVKDWGTVDWANGSLKDPDSDPISVKAAIIFLHGGGWVINSTFDYQSMLRQMSIDTGFPVFSIEYRLSHDHPFPTPLSDSFQGYCWIKNYAQKYLGVKFDKIIVWGDSSGGSMALSLPLLCIQRKVAVPDGIIPMCPIADIDVTAFRPSVLAGIDDNFQSSILMEYFSKSYRGGLRPNDNGIMNPIVADDELFKKDGVVVYPPVRAIISGHDQQRDSSFLLILKLVKLGIDIKAIEYKHQCGGFIPGYSTQHMFPEHLSAYKDCKAFIDYFAGLQSGI